MHLFFFIYFFFILSPTFPLAGRVPFCVQHKGGGVEKDRERMHREEEDETLVRHGWFFWRGYFTGSGNKPCSSRDTVPDMEGEG